MHAPSFRFALLAWSILTSFASLALVGSALGHGAYHDVVVGLSAKLAKNPNDAGLRFQLATAHAGHDEWDLCLAEVARVEALAPGKYRTGYLTGKSLAGKGQFGPALADLDGFLAAEPKHVGARVERARTLLKLKRNDDAFADYSAALKRSSDPELYVEAIDALRRNGRAEEAHGLAETGARKTRQDPAVLVIAVDCATDLGRTDEALAHLERLRRVWPRPEPWMQRKAELLAKAGRKEEALAAWRELHDHLMALPNLERAQPFLAKPLAACRRALGLSGAPAVAAPPAAR